MLTAGWRSGLSGPPGCNGLASAFLFGKQVRAEIVEEGAQARRDIAARRPHGAEYVFMVEEVVEHANEPSRLHAGFDREIGYAGDATVGLGHFKQRSKRTGGSCNGKRHVGTLVVMPERPALQFAGSREPMVEASVAGEVGRDFRRAGTL